MSSEDNLPDIPVGVDNHSEDLSKATTEVEAKVHVDTKSDNNGTVSNTHINSNGMEIDPITSEKRDVVSSFSKQVSIDTGGVGSSASGSSMGHSTIKETGGSFVVRMASGTEETSRLPARYSQRSLKKRPSLMQRLSRESSLSLQESWRSKSATTRLKNKKNYISYHNITYTVPQGRFYQKKSSKVILNNIRLVS